MSNNNLLKIMSLGGFGNVTQNLFVYEYQDHILLIDCGIGFANKKAKEEQLIIPDVDYLKKNRSKIRAIVLTHGHEDHIGGLPFVLPKIGKEIPIFGSRLTIALAEEKLSEYQISARLNVVTSDQKLNFGPFSLSFVHITHSVPDDFNVVIHTPLGVIYHAADYKFDWTPVMDRQTEVGKIALAGNQGVNLLVSDCVRSEKFGYTLSEVMVEDSFEREIRDCSGKFFVTTFSSNVSRWQQALNVIAGHNRKVALVGRSVEKVINIAARLGYLHLPKNIVIPVKKARYLKPHQVAFLIAGSQAQPGSALEKITSGEFRDIKIEPGDKVVFSADYIPGNEVAIHGLIDQLSRLGADVSYSEILDDLHVSGHGSQADMALMIGLVQPRYLLPIGGAFRQMKQFALLAQRMGYAPEKIFLPEKNQTIEMLPGGQVRLGPKM